MPEYLAPGVYVEETSFRSKSIEGVSTSTTGFVGPTRKGPVGETPELLTSFGDFERIYGGLEDLSFDRNYLAHAVFNYFNEGGGRLYIARVYRADVNGGFAQSGLLVNGANADAQARFRARFPGAAGNGRIILELDAAPATRRTLESAPPGTVARVGGNSSPATPARILGTALAPFSLPDNGQLRLVVGGADVDLIFRGLPTEIFGTVALPANLNLDEADPANTRLRVTIDGIAQEVPLPAGATDRDDLLSLINRELRGGYARLAALDEGNPGDPADRLVIGSDRRGSLASVVIEANPGLGLAAATVRGSDNPANNVGDLLRVSADEINTLLAAAGSQAQASLTSEGRLALTTVATGTGATLAIGNAPANSVHGALGLTPGQPAVTGADGATVTYYLKSGTSYVNAQTPPQPLNLAGLEMTADPAGGAEILTIKAVTEDSAGGSIASYDGLGLDPAHPRWIGRVFSPAPTRRGDALGNLYGLEIGNLVRGLELRAGLFAASNNRIVTLDGGTDGLIPGVAAYRSALAEFEQLEDISIVAAPGHSSGRQPATDYQAIQAALITHAEGRRAYRIAVLDTPPELTGTGAREVKSRIDSKYAALYYPWIRVANPLARPDDESQPREIDLPPSSFVCGIYARNDSERGVFKAPANEVVRGALRFESDINFRQQEVLNPLGINCLRFFPGRGHRVWGARTVSSDPEWKYVNIRRYFNYLEASVDRGTQWAVFEPNGERLWENVRETVSSFLYNEWKSGALLGTSPKEAFFVRCDRSTMTQNDLDNGRLICLIGVAAIKPAEFVIFRIGQKTADARS